MGQELSVAASIADGRAMASLSPERKKFVQAMIALGPNKKASQMAAAAAGFTNPVYGYELMRDENIIAALREEATKQLTGAALLGVQVMMEIAQDITHKDRYKAAKDLAAINGFTAEQKIVVEHIDKDGKALLAQVKAMAEELGLDPRQMVAAAGIIDADFTEVPEPEVDDSDW